MREAGDPSHRSLGRSIQNLRREGAGSRIVSKDPSRDRPKNCERHIMYTFSPPPLFSLFFCGPHCEKSTILWCHDQFSSLLCSCVCYSVSPLGLPPYAYARPYPDPRRLRAAVPITHRLSLSMRSFCSTTDQTTKMNHEGRSWGKTRRSEKI